MPNMNYSDMRTVSDQFRRGAGMNRTFKKGDSNSLVYLLQSALYNNGYSLNLNAHYDDATEAAVRAYQRDNGFAQDGIVRPEMLNKLFPADPPAAAAPKPIPAPRPVPAPKPMEYTIRLNGRNPEAIIRVISEM